MIKLLLNRKALFEVKSDELDNKYTSKVGAPQYLPKRQCPQLSELYDTTKYSKLISEINSSNLPEDEKKFLKFAATRHIVFRYDKIADYYAHGSKELQELMEKSALVIIDINDAIANGYVKLSKNIEKIMKNTGKDTKNKLTPDTDTNTNNKDETEIT